MGMVIRAAEDKTAPPQKELIAPQHHPKAEMKAASPQGGGGVTLRRVALCVCSLM